MAKVLVTGGAGYIGSHTLVDLIDHGHTVVSIDNYLNSDPSVYQSVEKITNSKIDYEDVDLKSMPDLKKVFEKHTFEAVIHFAALKSVGESVENPLSYYKNNIAGMVNLLQCLVEYGVENFIFSSSCSVYGNADELPVVESTPIGSAESPYARTKQIGEQIIADVSVAHPDIRFCVLRYFNPAGAHPSILIGESARNKANNLVPVITETAIGKRAVLHVFGDNYDTRDGTCIRDYIHVMDLAHAHTLAVEYLIREKPQSVATFNLGSGTGSTVLEVIKTFEQVADQKLNFKMVDRRPGDVEAVYADYSLAKKLLGWSPQLDLKDIMRTAWAWEQHRSN